MNVTYQDRNGETWRFDVDGTPYQAILFRRVLAAVRSVSQREALSLSYLADADANDAFLSDVEGAVLSALSKRYAATPPAPQPAPVPRPEPQDTDATQERGPYWWENI